MTTGTPVHDHAWGEWTKWYYYDGDKRDWRERYCMEGTCTAQDSEDRPHQHVLGRPQVEDHAPVEAGLVRYCKGCGHKERR